MWVSCMQDADVQLCTFQLHSLRVFALNQVHSHGPGATAAGSFACLDGTAHDGIAGTCDSGIDGSGICTSNSGSSGSGFIDTITRSVWSITSFDSGPVERALPRDTLWKRVPTQPREMQVG